MITLITLISYADYVALPAIAHSTPLLQQPIDISCPPNQQQQTYSSRLLLWTHAGTDRRTDTVPFHRPCSACYAGSADKYCTVATCFFTARRDAGS